MPHLSALSRFANARTLKLFLCGAARPLGLNSVLLRTPWRRRRLLILAYHGVCQHDEHNWHPDLYITPALLRRRMEILQNARCNVLPLDKAVRLLAANELPPRSVCITFDDGTCDFYTQAFPILQSFGFPATVYLTTYYSEFNRPIYDPVVRYMLWKSRERTVFWPEVFGSHAGFSPTGDASFIRDRMRSYPAERGLGGREKDALLARFAELLKVDYDEIIARRLMHIMNPAEIRELAAKGVDFQLHTHRHGVSRQKALFDREIADNRQRLQSFGISNPGHFCYPGGVHRPEFLPWLRESGILSATTCEPGLATPSSDPLLLPRIIDTSGMTDGEFISWVSGTGSLLPTRRYVESKGQFLEDRLRPKALAAIA